MRAIGLICSDAHGPSQSRMLSAHTAFRPDAGSFFQLHIAWKKQTIQTLFEVCY